MDLDGFWWTFVGFQDFLWSSQTNFTIFKFATPIPNTLTECYHINGVVGHTSFNAKMDLAKFGVILEDRTPWIWPTNKGSEPGKQLAKCTQPIFNHKGRNWRNFVYVPSRQFWDCGRWKSDSLWNFSIVGCQWAAKSFIFSEPALYHLQSDLTFLCQCLTGNIKTG